MIDLSLYLRTKFDGEVASPKSEPVVTQDEDAKNMSAVLDQKSYIEELNRHLKYVTLSFIQQFDNQILV